MGIFSKINSLFRSAPKDAQAKTAPLTPRQGGYLTLNMGGSAMNVATVYRCVDILAGSVANLPMMYKRQRNGLFEEDLNSRLHYLLTVQPEPRLSAVDFWRMIVQYLLLEGNAYIVPIYSTVTLELDRLVLVDPPTVEE